MNKHVAEPGIEAITVAIKFVFSWLIVLPAATILAGKLLTKPIPFTTNTKQLLKIPLKIFTLEATDGEVIVGFSAQLITFFFAAIIGGPDIHHIVKNNFGVDPGQFHSIFFFSALLTVIWASAIFLLHHFGKFSRSSSFSGNAEQHNKAIEALAKRSGGKR